MNVIGTDIPGVLIVEPDVFRDERGFFVETYARDRYRDAGIVLDEVQDNLSVSVSRGVLRGLHFQREPHAQGKLVRVASGRVFDVAVDIRPTSETYGRWTGVELSASDQRQLWIPAGLAHGFLSLEDGTVFEYKCSGPYIRESEGGIAWDDTDLGIAWPIPASEIRLSPKDASLPTFADFRRQ